MYDLKNVLVERDWFPHCNRQKEHHENTSYQEGVGGAVLVVLVLALVLVGGMIVIIMAMFEMMKLMVKTTIHYALTVAQMLCAKLLILLFYLIHLTILWSSTVIAHNIELANKGLGSLNISPMSHN